MSDTPKASGGEAPLNGLIVIESASFITGPLAGMLLAQLGATVIKLEPPGGDGFRAGDITGRFPRFAAHNRGKRSLVCNLRNPDDRDEAWSLLRDADVFIENARPGVMDRLGFSYEAVSAVCPRLVYCSISGFSRSGPNATRPGYDAVGQAVSGLMSLLVDPEHPRPVGPALSDTITGVMAALGVMGGLQQRLRTGKGSHVTTSMVQATMSVLVDGIADLEDSGECPGPYTRAYQSQSFALRTADSQVLVVHLSTPPKFWEAFTEAIGRPDLKEDTRFESYPSRVRHYAELEEIAQGVIEGHPLAHWLDHLKRLDVPCAPMNNLRDALQNSGVDSSGSSESGSVGDVPPFLIDGRIPRLSPAPPLGDFELGDAL